MITSRRHSNALDQQDSRENNWHSISVTSVELEVLCSLLRIVGPKILKVSTLLPRFETRNIRNVFSVYFAQLRKKLKLQLNQIQPKTRMKS